MDTPVPPEVDGLPALYGEGCGSINRRLLLGGLLALPVAARAGPANAVRSIRRLAWTGTAHVAVGGRSLDLHSRTTLELPLLRVRSTSYILAEGPAAARTLILEPDGAWLERGGTRSALPTQLAIHERQQYAVHAWLLLVQQRRRPGPGPLALSAPPYPDIVFAIGRDGYPVSADVTVDAPEPDRPRIAEHVTFLGRLESNRVRWPRRIVIAQNGTPYFDLTLTRFSAT